MPWTLFWTFKAELCQKRMASCFFCELALPFDKFEEHLNYCGSRTEKCSVCNRYVQMKDKYKHETSNCEYPPAPVVKPTRQARPLVHQSTAHNDDGAANRSGNRSAASASNHSIAYLPCEFCDELFPNTMLMQHQVINQLAIYTSRLVSSSDSNKLYSAVFFKDECENNPIAQLHYQLAQANLLNMFGNTEPSADHLLDDDDMQ